MSKETISYEDFSRLDIRVGTIREVSVVEGADKLLKLLVDVGEEEPRQILSAIREHVGDGESLVGRQTLFVCNLEPRTIRGLESNGMLFALGGSVGLVLLKPEEEVPPGTPAV